MRWLFDKARVNTQLSTGLEVNLSASGSSLLSLCLCGLEFYSMNTQFSGSMR